MDMIGRTSRPLAAVGFLAALAISSAALPHSAMAQSAMAQTEQTTPDQNKKPGPNDMPASHAATAPDQAKAPDGGELPPTKSAPKGPVGTKLSPDTTKQPLKEHATPKSAAAVDAHKSNTKATYHITATKTLKEHYRSQLTTINRANRPHFVTGTVIDHTVVSEIQPVPAEYMVGLPPVPAGLIVGYYMGYLIVYDPASYTVVDVVDLTA